MKQLALAITTVLAGLSINPSAEAVYVNPEGLGQVLLFPYYTTRAGWKTLINITNTSGQVVVAKVRFHEGYNSRDVFDFTIVLSPFDVWNGTVEDDGNGVPKFSTADKSCTIPEIGSTGMLFDDGTTTNASLAYTGNAADGGPTTKDRLREGYINVIMMGTAMVGDTSTPTGNGVDPIGSAIPAALAAIIPAAVPVANTPNAHLNNATAANATAKVTDLDLINSAIHVSGTPKNCANLRTAFSLSGAFAGQNALGAGTNNVGINLLKNSYQYGSVRAVNGTNPLKGSFSLVQSSKGWNASGKPTTLASFYAPGQNIANNDRAFGDNLVTAQLSPAALANIQGWNTADGTNPNNPAGLLDLSPLGSGRQGYDATFDHSFHEPELSSANTVGEFFTDQPANANALTGTHGDIDTISDQYPNGAADGIDNDGVDAVSLALRATSVVNQWGERKVTTANGWSLDSDWVVTFPTKRFYVDLGVTPTQMQNWQGAAPAAHEFAGRAAYRSVLPAAPAVSPATFNANTGIGQPYSFTLNAASPFTRPFLSGQSCDTVAMTAYDREENTFNPMGGAAFSPAPTPSGAALCEEVNILSFRSTDSAKSNVLESPIGSGKLGANISSSVIPTIYENGWMRLTFRKNNLNNMLPSIGFSIITRGDPTGGSGILNEAYIVEPAYTR